MSHAAPGAGLVGEAERHRLARRLDAAMATLSDAAAPLMVVDLDAFDHNRRDLAQRAGGKPVRVASKSLRVPALIERALRAEGWAGVLAYTVREAHWLHRERGLTDVVVGYPSVDRVGISRLLADDQARATVTLMVDSPDHLDVIEQADAGGPAVRIAVDVDAGLRLGRAHFGPKRSPLHDAGEVVGLVETAVRRGFAVVGVMTYEGQVAGVPDDVPGQRAKSAVVRSLKSASMAQLTERRAQVAAKLRDLVALEFWNAGGSGCLAESAADPAVTELTAGSGLLVPGLFDHYASFAPRPAAYYGLRVLRRPSAEIVTVAGGGFVASGAIGKDRLPIPWAPPGLYLTGLEGAGEVQTPLTGAAARRLRIGDLVWFRHAKSGELFEHTNQVHLVSEDAVAETVPSYRGLGLAW